MKKLVPLIVIVLSLTLYVYFAKIRPARLYDPTVRGSGTIEATSVVISARISGRILTMIPSEGDKVKAGDIVATLQCDEPEARLLQAEASQVQAMAAEAQARAQTAPVSTQQRLAQKEFDRTLALFKSASATQHTVDEAEAAFTGAGEQVRAASLSVEVARRMVKVAAAQVTVAQTQVKECTLVAPMDGVVLTRDHEPGDLALPGSSLLKIGRLDEVYTWIYVPNAEIGRVKLNEEATLVADTYPGREFAGRVSRVSEEAEFTPKSIQTKEDRTRLVYGVKVIVPNNDRALLPGMPIEAKLLP